MPAPQRYPAPHEQLRVLAEQARAIGLTFDEFWERAMRPGKPPVRTTSRTPPPPGAVVWPHDSADRRIAYDANMAAREGWRRAYENWQATTSEEALALLAPAIMEGIRRARQRERNRDGGRLSEPDDREPAVR